MGNKDLFSRVNGLPDLTPGEFRVAEFFQHHHPRLALETIHSIAEHVGVSKATVLRFVQRLGYTGFPDFKKHLRLELENRLDSPFKRYQLHKTQIQAVGDDIWQLTIDNAMARLQETYQINPREKIAEAAGLMASEAIRLYVTGQRISYAIAYHFWFQLSYLRPDAVFLDNQADRMANQLVDVADDCVLFAVSYQRYSRQTMRVMDHFVRSGGKVILLTDAKISTISHLAHILLIGPAEWSPVFSSRCSTLILIEALLAYMAQLLEKRMGKRLEQEKELCDRFDVFSEGPNAPALSGRRKNKAPAPPIRNLR